jgi:hypothetical protein
MELLIWALETGISQEIEDRLPPRTVSGKRSRFDPLNRAPIRSSGSVTRRIGRRRREASPVSVARKGCAARAPRDSRAVVPELPQSSGPAGRRNAPRPLTRTTPPGVSGLTPAPRARRMRAVDLMSSEVRAPEMLDSPRARAARSSKRWVMLLSPGTPRLWKSSIAADAIKVGDCARISACRGLAC